MLVLQVIEGHRKIRLATVRRNGIRYRGRTYVPTAMTRLDEGAGDPAEALGGALLGAAALGPAGAIIGSIVGTRGRTAIKIDTTAGATLIGTLPSREFPEWYVEIERLKTLATVLPPSPPTLGENRQESSNPETAVPRSNSGWLAKLLLGPFYFVRFGAGSFIMAAAATVLTLGFAWLILPVVAAAIEEWQNAPAVSFEDG